MQKKQVLIARRAYKTCLYKFQVRGTTKTTPIATPTLSTLKSGCTSPTLVSQTQTDLSPLFLSPSPTLLPPPSLEVALATDFLSTCPRSCIEDSDEEF